jgi:C4-dicarboxylate transporter DctM subunit
MAILSLFGLVIGLMLIGAPIAVALGLASTVFMLVLSDTSLASIAQQLFNAFAGHYTLLAIPFFILASTFMSTGGVAQRIIRFAIACVGHMRGGLAIAAVFACMLFAALSGSSPATVVAIGSICIAGMRQVGYSKDFAAGVICNAGTLGILIPPSIVMVVYAASVDVSVGRMFLAGVIPGILAGLMLMIGIYVAARVGNLPKGDWAGWGEVLASGRDAAWGLFLIVIILGGIYGGVFTPTEAAAVAAVYAFCIANFVYRDMGPLHVKGAAPNRSLLSRPWALLTAFVHPDAKKALFEAGKVTCMLMFIIANALILKHVLTEEQIPQELTQILMLTPASGRCCS